MAKVMLFSILILAGFFLARTLPLDTVIPTMSQEEMQGNITKPDCFLRKVLPDGEEIRINKTREEVGPNEYIDFIELCYGEEEERLSAGSLASLAG